MQTFKKLLFFLSSQERKHAFILLIMIIIMALLDMLGVASILPFMAVLSNPSLVDTNIILNTTFKFLGSFGIETSQEFLFVLGGIVLILLITSLTFKAITTYVQVRFVRMREYSISKSLVRGYLNQSYSWFLSRHSADLGKTILSEVQTVIASGLYPLIDLIAKSFIVISIITLLIVVDPKLALIVGFTLGGFYILIFYFVRNFLDRIGKERLKNNQLRFITVSEAFGATKEVKVRGLEETFIKSFSKSAKVYARTIASSMVLAILPRFILEAIAFGGILFIILYKMAITGSFSNSLPIISLYVFAGYRLMPALQQIYSSFTQLTFVSPSVDKIYYDLKNLKSYNKDQEEDIATFNNEINLSHIFYNYPNTTRTALEDINLNIPAKSTVGFVGPTGCGKTTTVDIILGLLSPQKGTLKVDGKVINQKNSKAWQRLIGYVPQHIYLSDDSVMANIAFGIEPKNINQDLIIKASKIANIHQFVMDELPNHYQTSIGERGVKLSGGQRQRIGIARALYHNPRVLILDEATSALDNQTEQKVMDAIFNFSKEITIILIAHRLNTVKNCDIVYKLEKGKIVDQGSFDELIKK